MKKTTFFLLLTSLLLGFSACETNDPSDPGNGTEKGHEYVDLGLPSGLKWATMNIGAKLPEQYGSYFAWGETAPKDNYNWQTYKWCDGADSKFNKYCLHADAGKVDSLDVLQPKDDPAHKLWGGRWHTPSAEQVTELLSRCSFAPSERNGLAGLEVKGPNGAVIFLPMAGGRNPIGLVDAGGGAYYWTSDLFRLSSSNAHAFTGTAVEWELDALERCFGLPIRPVCK